MTLLVTVFAAIASTLIWYFHAQRKQLSLGLLALMYWGAALMWLVDAIAEYAELGAAFFTPAPEDVLNDLLLGLSVVALGLIIWLVRLLVRDPLHVIRKGSTTRE